MRKINEALPDNVAYALSPLELDVIEFKDNDASDVNVLSKAYSNLIEANGSIILNSNKITNNLPVSDLPLLQSIFNTMAKVTLL